MVGKVVSDTTASSAGAQAYIGGGGALPLWGPGANPLGRGSGGKAPLKLNVFL